MAAETHIVEVPLVQGQDEGTQIAVLPLGKLSALQNARFRRLGRLGKRNGYRSIASTDAGGAPLGNGAGQLSCLGPRFCAVDDRFYRYDDGAGAWGYPALAGGAIDGGRLLNRWPTFQPASTFSPCSEQSPLNLYSSGGVVGTLLPSIGSLTYAQGIIWTSWCRWQVTPTVSAWSVLVTATDPTSGLEVFHQDLLLNGAATDNQQPALLSTGDGTVVLVSDVFAAGVKTALSIMLLTNRNSGFNPSVTFTVACATSAVNYYQGSQNEILIAYANGTATVFLGAWNTTTHAFTAAATTRGTAGRGEPSLLSCFGIKGDAAWVGFVGSISGKLAVNCYDGALATTIGNLDAWNGSFTPFPTGPITFAKIPGVSPTEVMGLGLTTGGGMAVQSFTSIGLGASGYLVANMQPLSQPFAVGTGVYVWVRHAADSQLGVATLIRVPQLAEYENIFRSACPVIETTLDDEDMDLIAAVTSGPVYPTPVATPLGYLALLSPTVESIVTTGPATYLLRKPLVVPVRHRTEGMLYSCASVSEVSGKHFVAGGQPMFVDARGAVEAGFVQAPKQPIEIAKLGGGGLSPSSEYQYTAYFESIDASGLIERSAPATPLVMALGGGDTRTRVQFSTLELTKKIVRLRIFRTLANQTQFFQLITIDVTPCVNSHLDGSAYVIVEDNAADVVVGSNTPLYTQLGSEFENAQFPACRFSMVGAGRLWLGGGFKGNVIQASKAFRPRLSVEFVDDDAFRVFLPADCTGLAFLDNVVAFTAEGIYLITGDGPDVAGVGAFSPPIRLPCNIGCVNPRSVVVHDDGVFFESARGMCLLPRGFADPIPQDEVMDTLERCPFITASLLVNTEQSAAGTSFAERTVQWTALADAGGAPDPSSPGVALVYDVARKAWSVDTFAADGAGGFLSTWDSQRIIGTALTAGSHPFRLQNTGFADGALSIALLATTGDMRLWGTFAHGVVNRVGLLGVLRSPCTLSVTKTTDRGVRATTRGYTGAPPDTNVIGGDVYLEVVLGSDEQRDTTMLRVSLLEASAIEGMSFIGLVIEADTKPQGFRLQAPGDRIN